MFKQKYYKNIKTINVASCTNEYDEKWLKMKIYNE